MTVFFCVTLYKTDLEQTKAKHICSWTQCVGRKSGILSRGFERYEARTLDQPEIEASPRIAILLHSCPLHNASKLMGTTVAVLHRQGMRFLSFRHNSHNLEKKASVRPKDYLESAGKGLNGPWFSFYNGCGNSLDEDTEILGAEPRVDFPQIVWATSAVHPVVFMIVHCLQFADFGFVFFDCSVISVRSTTTDLLVKKRKETCCFDESFSRPSATGFCKAPRQSSSTASSGACSNPERGTRCRL